MKQNYKQPLWAMITILVITFLATFSFSLPSFANQVRAELLKATNKKANGTYVATRFLKATKQPINPDATKKALIIGDSHAQDFFNSILENKALQDYQISTRSIPTRCQVYLGKHLSRYIAAKDKVFCEKSDSLKKSMKQIAEADVIFLVANWTEWSASELPQTIKNMKLSKRQKLFVIGRKSFGKVSVRKYLHLSKDKLLKIRNKPDAKQDKISSIMHNTLSKDILIDVQKLVCGPTDTCPIFTKDLKLISFDGGHLTKNGARYIGQLLFKKSALASL